MPKKKQSQLLLHFSRAEVMMHCFSQFSKRLNKEPKFSSLSALAMPLLTYLMPLMALLRIKHINNLSPKLTRSIQIVSSSIGSVVDIMQWKSLKKVIKPYSSLLRK